MASMRRAIRCVAVLAIGWATLSAVDYSPVVVTTSSATYQGHVYADHPSHADGLHFPGEPIEFTVRLQNWGTEFHQVVTAGQSPADDIRVRFRSSEGEVTPSPAQILPAVVLRRSGAAYEVPWTPRIEVGPREELRLTVAVEAQTLVPGVYHLGLDILVKDEDDRVLRPVQTRMSFELREAVGEEQAEVARRSAGRAIGEKRFDEALVHVRELQRILPTSYAAFNLLGMIASQREDWNAAATYFDQAMLMLQDRRDRAAIRRTRSHALDDIIHSLRSSAARAREARR
jgi:hypothetical protein